MKKIKYLFGFLVVGLGLLINQSFSSNFYIELVNTQFNNGFTQSDYSTSYSYLFKEQSNISCSSLEADRFFDGYGVYYYNTWLHDRLYKAGEYSSVCYDGVYWLNSFYGLQVYTGTCRDVGRYPNHLYVNINAWGNSSCTSNGGHSIFLGKNSQFGKVFSSLNNNQLGLATYPKYGFGNGYFSSGTTDYTELLSVDVNNSIRLFYNSTGGVNNLSDMNFVAPNSTNNLPVFAWEYFTNYQTVTNFGYVVDNNGGWKGKHFGSMGLGYSFIYNKDATLTNTKISWNTLGFSTVYDDILVNLRSFGGLDLIHNSSNGSFLIDGILILRKNQYTNNGDDGIIAISKNPNNTRQLLYQEFSCQTNNFNCLARGQSTGSDGNLTNYCPSYIINNQSSSYNPCFIISQGLLSYSGSTSILPFSNKSQLVNISDSPILSYLFNTSDSILGETYTVGNQFCIGTNICFTKVSSSNSIKENYLNNSYYNPYEYITSGDVNNGTYELCTSNAYFAAVNYEICHGLNPSDLVVISGAQYIVTDVQYEDGMVLKQVIPLSDYQDGYTTLSNGFTVAVCNSSHPCDIINSGSSYFSGGILDSGYYSFDNTGLFFKCPYPYNSILTYKGYDFSIGGFDIIGPINCMISAFQHGKSFNMFDNVGLFDFGPLMQGNSEQHKILFRFFDMLLILGFVLFFSLIYKRFK